MGILTNIVTADEDDIEAVGLSQHPIEEWSGIEAREIDTAKIVAIHCLLSNDSLEEAFSAYEPVYVADEDSAIVIRIPDEIVEKLAELDEEQLENVGAELAATEEFEIMGWPVEEVQALLSELAALAHTAESDGQTLLVWMHPLLT